MTSQLRIGLIALAILPAAGAACSARPAGEPPPAPVTVTTPSAAASTAPTAVGKERADEVETCGTRSEASFPAAVEYPANLVAGPFVLVGAGLPTPASVVESLGGQKHQVLVRAGHEVTLRVGRRAREHISLGYGSLPQGDVGYDDGHPAVTFVACRPEEDSGSSVAGEAVTFWSGFVFARKPSCAPLDVHVVGEQKPYRIDIPLGAAC